MKMRIVLLSIVLALVYGANAQTIKVNAGPEFLHSFSHDPGFWGAGVSAQGEVWVKERLGLGLNTGFLRFASTRPLIPTGTITYNAIPVLAVIKYPLPLIKNLYGQDAMGYTIATDVHYRNNGEKVPGGFTYYFSLGYEFAKHFDVAVKVGRSRFDKKDRPANVNEHNLGLKLAYIF
ncbi:porin family protein [Niabella pedocola]|uniref:Porin family protein n=1 Tax=Niabella pedocola TaxID=1752077 RepID=A0ABS8PWL4_9BACT|nr:outer membrane beta-barrel protein [Niabella pedocola]MCD2425471.1 porin family protein [Niabella pedocola]